MKTILSQNTYPMSRWVSDDSWISSVHGCIDRHCPSAGWKTHNYYSSAFNKDYRRRHISYCFSNNEEMSCIRDYKF